MFIYIKIFVTRYNPTEYLQYLNGLLTNPLWKKCAKLLNVILHILMTTFLWNSFGGQIQQMSIFFFICPPSLLFTDFSIPIGAIIVIYSCQQEYIKMKKISMFFQSYEKTVKHQIVVEHFLSFVFIWTLASICFVKLWIHFDMIYNRGQF